MLDLVGYTPDKDLSKFKILEPSFGCGDFLTEIARRISQSAERYNFNASEIVSRNLYGCEIDADKYNISVNNIKNEIPGFSPENLRNEDFLFTKWDCDFDFIVGNPPYIRYENIPAELRDTYKSKFSTFHYRCDIYVLFFEHCLRYLSSTGQHCFICSNRWIKNEYGKKLRALISGAFNLDYLIDIEDLDAFNETVSAYPAITVISSFNSRRGTKTVKIGSLEDLVVPLTKCTRSLQASDNIWDKISTVDELQDFHTIRNQGYEIGIGVATGADKIFINSGLISIVEEDLLIPIVNSRDLTDNKFNWKGSYLLNPYDNFGNLIDLDQYPNAKKYLEHFRPQLEERHINKKGRCWYALIDKVKPLLVNNPKILLPDITGNRKIFVDNGKFYPAHNIYYITGKSKENLELLAAILMSDFVRAQIDNISNKMNGGIPRWQSQSIRKLRIPLISSISLDDQVALRRAYHGNFYNEINEIVKRIADSQKYKNQVMISEFPKSLFDYEY